KHLFRVVISYNDLSTYSFNIDDIETNYSVQHAKDEVSGFTILLKKTRCTNSNGRKLEKPQKLVIKMHCNKNHNVVNDKDDFIEKDDGCDLELRISPRFACPQCTCHNFWDMMENGKCWTRQRDVCNFPIDEPAMQERDCSASKGCYEPNIQVQLFAFIGVVVFMIGVYIICRWKKWKIDF
uniref:Uncharacterized protein n=1 Tax=Clytia hemisphaerica TaxID=252671 RepID=A0A7M6DN81_9CNID